MGAFKVPYKISQIGRATFILLLALTVSNSPSLPAEPPVSATNDSKGQADSLKYAQNQDSDRKAKAIKEELARLQGTWVWSAHTDDSGYTKHLQPGNPSRAIITISGNKWSSRNENEEVEHVKFIRVDPTTDPKSLDWSATSEFKPGQTRYTIYELDTDTLRMRELHKTPQTRPNQMKIIYMGGRIISTEDEEYIDCFSKMKR
jgi:uncharacterized protein (TIGR03067 family)